MSRFSLVDFDSSLIQIRDWLWMFPPKNKSEGTVSWWLNCKPSPVLIDCPEITKDVIHDLKKLANGLTPKILLTNRDAHGKVSQLNKELGWPVLLQEQEAYLLPGIENIQSFEEEFVTSSGLRLLWTPGPTPGSCVVYAPEPWNVLFCGRLLIPVAKDQMASVRTRRTFHWDFQKKSVEKILSWIPSDHLPLLASGRSSPFLDGEKLLPWDAWDKKLTS